MAADFFSGTAGNEGVKRRLSALIAAGRVPHAVLFEGEKNAGKFTLAKSLAEILLCSKGTGCGVCRNCRLAGSLNHPDLLIYEPEKSVFPVDTVRRINADAALKPFSAAVRVIILKHCELMTPEAQNAFLKTLEEPPSTVRFILLTRSANALLDTVRSRCVSFLLTVPGGNAGDETPYDFARILRLASGGREADLQAELFPLSKEKDRQVILDFFGRLCEFIARAARDAADNGGREYGFTPAALSRLYYAAEQTAAAIKQNGNKPLLFSLFSAEAVRCGTGK